MGLNLNDQGGDFKRPAPLDAGTYPCRTVGIVDLGLQPQSYKGEEKAPGREVSVTYEFVDEFLKDENGDDDLTKPRWLSESFVVYNLESDKAKSTLRYKAIDPTNQFHGDLLACVDQPCNVTVVLNPNKKNPDRPYENVAAVSTMRLKDVEAMPPLVNPSFVFDLEDPDLEVYERIPAWIRKKVESNLEFPGSRLATMLEDGPGAAPPKEDPGYSDGDNLAKAILDDENPY